MLRFSRRITLSGALLVAWAGGCGGDAPAPSVTSPASCGDGTCEGGETCATCPSDCGSCGGAGAGASGGGGTGGASGGAGKGGGAGLAGTSGQGGASGKAGAGQAGTSGQGGTSGKGGAGGTSGQAGSAGGCASVCKLGDAECVPPNGYLTCEKDAFDCPGWVARTCKTTNSCPGGTPSSLCTTGCAGAPECTLGAAQCVTTSGYQLCEDNAAGCPTWTPHPCKIPGTCVIDPPPKLCTIGCPTKPACTLGASECVNTNGFRTCDKDALGCAAWIQYVCKVADSCTPGTPPTNACTVGCPGQKCTLGALQCTTVNTYQQCEAVSGCPTWKPYTCKMPNTCFPGGKPPAACL